MIASRRVLDGIVPVFRHTPPIMSLRSTIATRRSSLAAAIAAFWPPGPEPITSTSKSYISIRVTRMGRRLKLTPGRGSVPATGLGAIGEKEWTAMTLLRSYVGGTWVTPAGEGRPVFDAVTGDEVARVSSDGIDMAG